MRWTLYILLIIIFCSCQKQQPPTSNGTYGNYTYASYGNLATSFSNDWDNWVVKDNNAGVTYTVRTNFSEDWDSWEVRLNGTVVMRMSTDFSNDFDNWQIDDRGMTDDVHRACVMFIPVFISAVHQQGVM